MKTSDPDLDAKSILQGERPWAEFFANTILKSENFESGSWTEKFQNRKNSDPDLGLKNFKIAKIRILTNYNKNPISVIPAAILQEPFLNISLPASVTYGALGFLYGFGLSHGFDKQGGNYDANGVQRSWW
jgi:putative endopeptidase